MVSFQHIFGVLLRKLLYLLELFEGYFFLHLQAVDIVSNCKWWLLDEPCCRQPFSRSKAHQGHIAGVSDFGKDLGSNSHRTEALLSSKHESPVNFSFFLGNSSQQCCKNNGCCFWNLNCYWASLVAVVCFLTNRNQLDSWHPLCLVCLVFWRKERHKRQRDKWSCQAQCSWQETHLKRSNTWSVGERIWSQR